MKTLAILPKRSVDRGELLNCFELPLFYMNDYSRVGLQVSAFQEALKILRRYRYEVSETFNMAQIAIQNIYDIPIMVRLLSDHGIESQMSDMVTGIYQG